MKVHYFIAYHISVHADGSVLIYVSLLWIFPELHPI